MARIRERGAAAVEFAIILPLLLLVIAAVVDLTRLMYTQSMVTAAAREGVRMKAMGYSAAEAEARTQQAAIGLDPAEINVTYPNPPGDQCGIAPRLPTHQVTMRVQYTGFDWVILDVASQFFGGAITLPTPAAEANMRCGG